MSALFVAWRAPQPAKLGWSALGCLEKERGIQRFWRARGAHRADLTRFRGMEQCDRVYDTTDQFRLFDIRLLAGSWPESP